MTRVKTASVRSPQHGHRPPIESAHFNGAKSHSPVTPGGKATNAQNARKHGVSATILLATDSSEESITGSIASTTASLPMTS